MSTQSRGVSTVHSNLFGFSFYYVRSFWWFIFHIRLLTLLCVFVFVCVRAFFPFLFIISGSHPLGISFVFPHNWANASLVIALITVNLWIKKLISSLDGKLLEISLLDFVCFKFFQFSSLHFNLALCYVKLIKFLGSQQLTFLIRLNYNWNCNSLHEHHTHTHIIHYVWGFYIYPKVL